eukprot:gene13398-15777_t
MLTTRATTAILVIAIVVASCLVLPIQGGSPDEWSSRVIYQLITDRFALSDNAETPCQNISTYCGGSFIGLAQHLDYIQGMGFDAIWISPVITNTPQCHKLGIWVMLDVVANHVGPVGYNYTTIAPFDQASHYHGCSDCPSACTINNFSDQDEVELCRLSGLPDLNQNNTYVRETLLSWIQNITSHYGFDGIRVDTVPEVDTDFWTEYNKAAGMYAVGEVYNGDVNYVAPYQQYLDGVLSYPMFFVLRSVFAQQQSMYNIQSIVSSYQSSFLNTSLLGTFIDNHDQPRFLNVQPDTTLYKNALTYVLTSIGIPIIYYGSEQSFNGGNDPDNREPLWPTQYASNTVLYQWIQTINEFTRAHGLSQHPQVQRYADDHFYAYTRGNAFIALTNGGSNQGQISRTITFQPYANGTTLYNIFWPNVDFVKTIVITNMSETKFAKYLQLGDLTDKNIGQLRLLNTSVLPVSYDDKFYTRVLSANGFITKLESECEKNNYSKITLHVQVGSEAIPFYEKYGYSIETTIPNYYRHIEPTDCHIMAKVIQTTTATTTTDAAAPEAAAVSV